VARLVPEKGIDIVLKAAAQLQGDWQIRIIGGGPSRAALEQLAYTLKIADRVLFCGQLPSTEMPLQYQQMDVLVVASRTLPNWKEQFGPRASLEAMAAGVPVIGSHSGAIPDVLADAGCIVPENDIPALVNALRQLMTDAGLYQSLQTKGTARVLAHFTHEQVANATVQVYQQLMTGQKHRL
jgi:glycosyltransferase involved in cell wall biosynthesis